ncbi:hypothetical protein [Streptomyces zhihengii]|uniref:hypothetical protein n=1 Tax=Streptomyces zhihengii TaxID=1818004 RepID=UPI0033B036A6
MTLLTMRRTCLSVLIVNGLFHVWGYFAPKTWYETFPGFGDGWLTRLGPYNEHLVADTAAMFLAMTVLTTAALCHPKDNRFAQVTGASWLAFNVLHLLYHVQHLGMYSVWEKVTLVSFLSLLTIVSALLLIPVSPARDTDRTFQGADGGGGRHSG